MHFWIDKRSQQCGFGRSRVAASLSGAGGSGMGLTFGHPPRRMGGSNKSSTRSTPPDCHHASSSSNSSVNVSRSHPHYQQHASNNNNFSNVNNCQHAHSNANTSNSIGGSSSTTTATATATITSTTNMNTNAAQLNLNNNSHQQYAYQQQQSSHSNHLTNSSNTNTINNNNVTSAILTGAGTIVPTTHGYNQRAATVQYAATQPHQVGNHHYDLRSYHHPQFGNMSLRHYQHAVRTCGMAHANAATALQHSAYRSANAANAGSMGATHVAAAVQHVEQGQYRPQAQTMHHNVYSHAQHSENSAIASQSTAATSYAIAVANASASSAQRYNSTGGSMRATHVTESSHDVQLLSSHLKCGLCASLVLVSVFVVGAKFYFDHQGTGLEVLIFCAFCATFFLAACTASMCRVPKSLLPGARSAGMLDEHQHTRSGSVHCGARVGTGRSGIAVSGAAMDDNHETLLYAQQAQLIAESAAAGPPPYHIAIFFPETENSSKTKETTLDDESPPPSYDKILI